MTPPGYIFIFRRPLLLLFNSSVPSGNVARIPLDFMDPLAVESTTTAGMTVYYQFFHRDTFFPGGGNWTSGIGVTWAP